MNINTAELWNTVGEKMVEKKEKGNAQGNPSLATNQFPHNNF